MIKDINGKEWKVVIVTPAGRQRYLSILKKYVYRDMAKGIVDEWQLWMNTIKESDIAYIESMGAENSKSVIHRIKDIVPSWEDYDAQRTGEFFKHAHDDGAIYIRFDDDVVWCEENAVEKLAQARVSYKKPFVIYPNIINNTIMSQWHQENGSLGMEAGACKNYETDHQYLDEFSYADSGLVELIHKTFIKRHTEGTLDAYYFMDKVFDEYTGCSINSVVFLGRDKLVPSNLEEPWISWEEPKKLERPNMVKGDALVVHFQYHTQRDFLDTKPEYLTFYKNISEKI